MWPDHGTIKKHLPQSFKKNFKDYVFIIGCNEHRALQQEHRHGQSYKHNNTSNYLIGITPSGAISFLSLGWFDRMLNKLILRH